MQKVICNLCGKEFTRPGLVGHMRFKHGRDYKAPMLEVKRAKLLITPLELEKAVIATFDGQELKDDKGEVVGTFKVAKGAREATLVDVEGKLIATLAAPKGEAEKALLQLNK